MLWGFGWGVGGREFYLGLGWFVFVFYSFGIFFGVVFYYRNSFGYCVFFYFFREDIIYRLLELDSRGFDEENLDSETSVSIESLLEERVGRGVSEG